MFDTTKLRTQVLDQLQPWKVYLLRRALRSSDGRVCPMGMEFRFEFAIVNLKARQAEIHGLDPESTSVVFESRNEEHREWFDDTGREWRPGQPRPPAVTVAAPAESEEGWLRWLAGLSDFEKAAAILAGEGSGQNWGSARADADVLRAAAAALRQNHPTMARWLATRSLDLYHTWMSQATSGGEGTAMQYEVRNELEELRRMVQ
jgi:hypothetical protein